MSAVHTLPSHSPRPAGQTPEGAAPAAAAREAVLVERARAGDARAFGELYTRHGPMVHAVLLTRVARADVDDLTQEVFVLAWRRLADLRDPEAIAGWLVAIARHRATDWERAASRRRDHERAAGRDGTATAADPEADPTDTMLGAIRALPETYREALLMRLVAGLTGAQIAARLGMTPGSVRVHLHRGMKLLREHLAEDQR